MDQLEQGIQVLVNPTISNDIKTQANQYLESVKASPQGWQLGLELFLKQPKSFPEARLFSLQIIGHFLNFRFQEMSEDQILVIRDSLWKYLTTIYLVENEDEPVYIRTRFATTFALIFRRLYIKHWVSFFDDFIGILNHEKAIKATDFFLRVVLAIDEEVVNTTTFVGKDEIKLNTDLKDYMRDRDIPKLVPVWNKIILAYQNTNPEFSSIALKIAGSFSDWIDIGLVVVESFLTPLFQFVRAPKGSIGSLEMRNSACDCLNQIISKGMQPPEKMRLLQMFGVIELLDNLSLDDPEFILHVAKLANKIGLEFYMIWKNSPGNADLQANAYNYLSLLMPHILKFMSIEDEDTSVTVFPTVNEMLNLLKQQTTKVKIPLTDSQNALLSELLKAVIAKFKYPTDFDWEELDEEDEEGHFGTMRKSLKIFYENMSTLNKPLFDELVHSFVISIFTSQISSNSDWTQLEVALRILYQYGSANNKNIYYITDPNNPNSFNHLGDMVYKMILSNVLSCNHPSLAPLFFENVVRYYQFFEVRTDLIPEVLACFLDRRGVYHESKPVRCRVWYLFLRFIKLLKEHTAKYVQNIVPSLQEVLVINAELPEDFKQGVPLTSQDITTSTFDAHLYLFEAVSTLLAYADGVSDEQKVSALEMVLTPLITGIQEGINRYKSASVEDPLYIIQLHHWIMAVGSVAKGLPDIPKNNQMSYPWIGLLKQSTEIILNLLELTSQYKVIRDAARFTFSRLLSATGSPILPLLITLIRGFVVACEPSELIDFFNFITQPLHFFAGQMYPFMNEMLGPLITKAFTFLNFTPSGTDDMVLIINLRKSYVGFLAAIFNSNLEGVLCSETNQNILPDILMSLIVFSKDSNNSAVQKMSFNLFAKMVNSWLINDPAQNPETRSTLSPNFKENFVEFTKQQIIPTAFEVPMQKAFDINDGQSILIFGELTNLHQLLFRATGNYFLDYLKSQFLGTLNCPPDLQQQFIDHLQRDSKTYRKFFQDFITEARKSAGI